MKFIERAVKKASIAVMSKLIKEYADVPVPDVKDLKSILVIRPDRLGDFVLSIPAIAALKENMDPHAKLTILVGKRGEELAGLFFGKDEILVHRGYYSSAAKLLSGKFDAVINFHSYPFSMTSGLLTLHAGSKIRIGFKETENIKNKLAPKIYNKGVILNDDSMHEKEKNIKLIEVLGVKYDYAKENSYLDTGINGLKDRNVVGIHPTLLKEDNRWSKEKYVELARQLIKMKKRVFVFYGRGEEKELKRFLSAANNVAGLECIPENDIISIMNIAADCGVFICNDSGIMHCASLVTDVIAVFGPSVLSRWKPIGPNKVTCLQKDNGVCDRVEVSEVLDKLV